MKKISSIIIAVAAIFAVGCNDNIPKIGDYNSARVKEVVFDEVLTNGLDIDLYHIFRLMRPIRHRDMTLLMILSQVFPSRVC